jgi:TetR/AcrR family transcriptional regulator, transcriptional repressor for nem operon
MARPKEFEREMALRGAIGLFSEHGFEGTSTDALVKAMGINRQSMYDTFGDKWRLYLEALQSYVADSIGDQLRALNAAPSAMKGLEAFLGHAVNAAIADPAPACLGLSAICEFGRSDPEVTLLTETAGRTLLSALERRLAEAKMERDVPKDMDVTDAANFIVATVAGIKIAARGGAQPQTLRGIARMALRSLYAIKPR